MNIVKNKTQSILLSDSYSRRYFSGVDIDEGVMLIGKHKYYLTDARYFYALKEKLSGSDITPVLYKGRSTVLNVLKKDNMKTLYIDFEKTSVKEYTEYKKFKVEIKDCSKKLKLIRSVKTPAERENIRKACKVVNDAFYKTIRQLKVGVTEKQIAEFIEKEMLIGGAESTSFSTIVAFGKNSAVPHHQTGNTVLKNNMPVLIDVGCKVNGYCSDLTRTVFFGVPDKKFLDSYQAVLQANETAESLITDRTTTDKADKIARNVLKGYGLDSYFTHSLGHGLGLEIHEYPTLSKKKKNMLKNGMVFTVEPGVYFDGEFGIRIEDTCLLKDGRVERLFTDDKKLIII